MRGFESNNIWELVDLPENQGIGSKWEIKVKVDGDGCVWRYKARLVAQGLPQQRGEDYNETIQPVVSHRITLNCYWFSS